jgi:hypothetical protein
MLRVREASLLLFVFLSACSAQSAPTTSPSAPSAPATTARLAVSQTSYGFPATVVGQSAMSPSFELSATGTGSLVVGSIATSNPAEFVPTDTANCTGTTLVGGSSTPCRLSARFQPVTSGVRSAQITVTGSDGSRIAVALFGSALGDGSSATAAGGSGDGGSAGGSGGGGDSAPASGGSFPQAPCVANTTHSISLTVINATPYLIQLAFAGPTQQSLSVAPGALQIVPFLPGNYTLTGAVPDTPNVTLRPSTWALSSGCDYLLRATFSPTSASVGFVR